jgi:hypothetical protein
MIVVRRSVVIDEPVERAGCLWAEFVRQRISDRSSKPDEWLEVDNACGVMGAGDVAFEAVSAARTRVTLSVELDFAPSESEPEPEMEAEVEATFRRAVAHLERFHDFVDARIG